MFLHQSKSDIHHDLDLFLIVPENRIKGLQKFLNEMISSSSSRVHIHVRVG